MNIADVRAEIERMFPTKDGIYASRCQTGDEYVKIGEERRSNHVDDTLSTEAQIPGVVREGVPRVLYSTEPEACWAFMDAFKAYANWWKCLDGVEPGTLFWRYAEPRLFLETAFENDRYDPVVQRFTETEGPSTVRPVCYIRSRLVITDKPVVWPDLAAYHAANALTGDPSCPSQASPAPTP